MKIKRFLVSTTIAHNPGDEIIWFGIRNLLEVGLKIKADYVYYNRNPDLQVSALRVPRPSVGNYLTDKIDLEGYDGVILAGSPEFTGGPMEYLYNALHNRPDIPVYALGIGAGHATLKLSSLDQEILSRSKVLITRSDETIDILRSYGINHGKCLPCPALFSASYDLSADMLGTDTAYILQAPGTRWHEVDPSYLNGVHNVNEVLTIHVKELNYYRHMGKQVRYAASGGEVLRHLRRYGRTVSTRLHAAIAGLSLGIPGGVVGDKDFRITTALKPYKDVIGVYGSVAEAGQAKPVANRDEILDFKWQMWDAWLKELSQCSDLVQP